MRCFFINIIYLINNSKEPSYKNSTNGLAEKFEMIMVFAKNNSAPNGQVKIQRKIWRALNV